jgi:hypothetical protein
MKTGTRKGEFQRVGQIAERVIQRLAPPIATAEQAQSGRNDEITRPARKDKAPATGSEKSDIPVAPEPVVLLEERAQGAPSGKFSVANSP